MPIHIFTEVERTRLDAFPEEITHDDLITFFTLSEADREQLPFFSAPHNRLGFAIQLCTLRFMGFVPEELTHIPPAVVEYVAEQIDVEPLLVQYGARAQTRTDHFNVVQHYLGYRRAEQTELTELSAWLLERALEPDKPPLLFELACQKLRTEKVVRPAVWRLERLITAAHHQAQTETMRRLAPLLTAEKKEVLDALLVPDPTKGGTPLAWLRRPATTNSPKAIVGNLEKLDFLKELGIHTWSVDALNPNRLKLLAQVARRSSGQALQRAPAERRYPILTAFLAQSLADITDETLDMFDHYLWETSTRAERDLETFRKSVARTTNETLVLFKELGRAVLDPTIRDTHLLAWCNNWYLREETLQAATNTLVNFHAHQPLVTQWGSGTLSSSDGQRFPTSGKIRNATPLPRYFGYGRGVTFYTWTTDQFSQYGTKVIPATVRDATYVLDAILDNETELSLVEHATDTAGYTEIVFALFDLLGMQFAPRLRDLGDQHLYRLDRGTAYPTLRPRLKGLIKQPLILDRWDDMLRVAGSLKLGWVTASLFISKLQAYPRQNALTRVLQEYGRLIKTIFILRYLESEPYRRTINRQLNKGEALHALRRFLFFANEGIIRRRQEEAQTNQAQCLNLLTNAVVVWNTLYMERVLATLAQEGGRIDKADIALLSPARSAHLNPYGKFYFDVEREFRRKGFRPLR